MTLHFKPEEKKKHLPSLRFEEINTPPFFLFFIFYILVTKYFKFL